MKALETGEEIEVIVEGRDAPGDKEDETHPNTHSLLPDGSLEAVVRIGMNEAPPEQAEVISPSEADTSGDTANRPKSPPRTESSSYRDSEHALERLSIQPANSQIQESKYESRRGNTSPTTVTRDSPSLAESMQPSQHKEEPSLEGVGSPTMAEPKDGEAARLDTGDVETDSRKRKRRSGTPELSVQDVRAKKPRNGADNVPAVHLKEDVDVAMIEIPAIQDNFGTKETDIDINDDRSTREEAHSPALESSRGRAKKHHTSRYQDAILTAAQPPPMDAMMPDRPTIPALHPVTSSLYIRNLMRPLRPENLRKYLISLASPPSQPLDTSIIKSLFLDAMKTHALVSFSNTTAASRVRASLHSSIWPPEGNRKELWVDFIPDESIDSWISKEEHTLLAEKEARAKGHPVTAKRFEVIYPTDINGSVIAVFQEVGAHATAPAHGTPSLSHAPTRQPAFRQRIVSPSTQTENREVIQASLKTLDDLFPSTTTLPRLFFQPVPDDVAHARLRELDRETSRDWMYGGRRSWGVQSEVAYRYTFGAGPRVIEGVEDHGPWSLGGGSESGSRGGRRGGGGGGGGGGGYRGRGRGRGGFGLRPREEWR